MATLNITSWVPYSGHLLMIGTTGATPASTGYYPLAPVTAVTGSATCTVNGSLV